MISEMQKKINFYNSSLAGKLSIILEEHLPDKRNDILDYFQSIDTSSYIALLGRENSMIPFLTVEGNLFLGLSKKDKKELLPQVKKAIAIFKLSETMLNKSARELNDSDQTIFQIIRALVLNQTIIIFDNDSNEYDTSVFLNNLLPILKLFSKNKQATIVIVSSNKDLANSNYYDQCILLEQLYK